MSYLKEIDLIRVICNKTKNSGFQFQAVWKAVTYDESGYGGPFIVEFTGEGIETKRVEVNDTRLTCDMTDWKKEERYYIQVKVETQGAVIASRRMELLLTGIEDVKVYLFEDALKLSWSGVAKSIVSGNMTIRSEEMIVEPFIPYTKRFDLPLIKTAYDRKKTFSLCLHSFGKDAVCAGPDSECITVCLLQPVLRQIVSVEEDAGSIKISGIYENPYYDKSVSDPDGTGEGVPNAQISLCLLHDSGTVVYGEKQPMDAKGGQAVFRFPKSDEMCTAGLYRYRAACMISTDFYENRCLQWEQGIPLGEIVAVKSSAEDGVQLLTWEYDGVMTPTSYEIAWGEANAQTVRPLWRNETYDASAADQEVTIVPFFGQRKGRGRSFNLFLPAFYLDGDNFRPLLSPGGQESLSLFCAAELFSPPLLPDAAEESNGITVTKKADGYYLEIEKVSDVTPDTLHSFFADMEKKHMTAGGIASVREQLVRCVPMRISDMLLYHFGFDNAARCVDLYAGMTLWLEGEAFKYKETAADDSSGFYTVSVSEYPIRGGTNTAGEYVLKFDNFVSRMSEFFQIKGRDNVSSDVEKAARYCAGGLMDLSRRELKKPWVRLIYPSLFRNSSANTSAFPGEHVMFLFSDSLAQMEESMNLLKQATILIDLVPSVIVHMRGRACVSVKIPIVWRGSRRLVDASTTLGQLMEEDALPYSMLGRLTWLRSLCDSRIGIKEQETIVYRKSGMLPVKALRCTENERLLQIPLLRGDVLTFV